MTALAYMQALREIVRSDLVAPPNLELAEDEPGSTCPTVKLSATGQALTLRPEGCRTRGGAVPDRLFPLLRLDEGGLTASCDYVVWYPRDTVLWVLLIELKSGDLGQAQQQINNTKLLVDGLADAMKLHRSRIAKPAFAFRGIAFSPRIRAAKGFKPPYGANARMPEVPYAACSAERSYALDYFCV